MLSSDALCLCGVIGLGTGWRMRNGEYSIHHRLRESKVIGGTAVTSTSFGDDFMHVMRERDANINRLLPRSVCRSVTTASLIHTPPIAPPVLKRVRFTESVTSATKSKR